MTDPTPEQVASAQEQLRPLRKAVGLTDLPELITNVYRACGRDIVNVVHWLDGVFGFDREAQNGFNAASTIGAHLCPALMADNYTTPRPPLRLVSVLRGRPLYLGRILEAAVPIALLGAAPVSILERDDVGRSHRDHAVSIDLP